MNVQSRRSHLGNLIRRAQCHWFGCVPDYDRPNAIDPYYVVPCKRCGAHDTSYADRVGDTPHNRMKERLHYWCWRRWWPMQCTDCRHRFGSHHNCMPF